ncbi:MAG: peptidyl-prolyl cis-trans isomerase [Candidatus Omnitrophica bacterium]|nr:peptidyl-prolyl cis-trans isomerase [Candidatus Omnitrophota bacterium]
MSRLLIYGLVIFGLGLSGCGEGKGIDWFKFGRSQSPKSMPTEEQVSGTVLATVNGRVITLEDFTERVDAYNAEIQSSQDIPESVKPNYLIKSKEDKKRLLDGMVERELLIAEAVSRGIDKDRELLQAIKALKEQLLFAKIIEAQKTAVSVSAQEIENFYNTNQEVFVIPEERKVSMMVLPTEDKAKEVLIQLLQGGDFSALARENSTDPSAASGGDIGFIVRTSPFPQDPEKKIMFDKFEELAFSLELNKPSTIFPGPNGYYLIKTTEIKPARQRLLSEVYPDIEQGLLMRKQDAALKTMLGNLRKTANIILHDDLIKE